MRPKPHHKLSLGEHINQYISNNTNPITIRPILIKESEQQQHKKQITRKPYFSTIHSTLRELRNKNHSCELNQKYTLTERLNLLLEKAKAPLGSRLLAEEERDVKMLSERQRVINYQPLNGQLEVYGRAKLRMNWQKQKKSQEELQKSKEKIKQLFEEVSPKKWSTLTVHPVSQTVYSNSKTNSYFCNSFLKPWQTVRVNDIMIKFSPKKPQKKRQHQSSLLFRTING